MESLAALSTTQLAAVAAEATALLSQRLLSEPEADRLLTPEEAAERLGLTREQVMQNWRRYGGTKITPKVVRFSAQAVEEVIQSHQRAALRAGRDRVA